MTMQSYKHKMAKMSISSNSSLESGLGKHDKA